jgi:hypothetical protein
MPILIGGLPSQAVYVAAQLGIADLLEDGPKGTEWLANEAGADPSALYRILRALASMGIFEERAGRVFQLTPMANLLRSGVDGSLRDLAVFMGADWHWQVWGKALYSARTGNSAWRTVHGQDVFDYFSTNQEPARIFNNAMTSLSTTVTKGVLEAYDFASIETLVDVAGGHGRFLTGILQANPGLRGILFDLPKVIAGAKEMVEQAGVASRCELSSGDFFIAVPANADGYIMKSIIHDWDDDRALRILKNISSAMRADARVLLVEAVITEGNERDFGKLLDLEMLVSPGGKERTAAEYKALLADAGLRMTGIIPTRSPYSVIEAVAL